VVPVSTEDGGGEDGTVTAGVAALWSARNSLRILVKRDLAVKYQQSVLGYFWSLIEPLGMGLIYWFVFGVLYSGATRRHLGDAAGSYPLFLITGIFAWMWASSALTEATNALTGQARLITTMNVPRQVFPIGRVTGRFAEYLAGLPILLAIAVIYLVQGKIQPGWWPLLALPLAVTVQFVLLVGLALLLSACNVLMRDIERFMRLIIRVLFYATPIIYPLALVRDSGMPSWVKIGYELNPLVGIFQLHHAIWYPDEFPDARLLAVTVLGSLLVLAAGWWSFGRLEPAVLKEL
jgi:ABC-2 type transport system permease protein